MLYDVYARLKSELCVYWGEKGANMEREHFLTC